MQQCHSAIETVFEIFRAARAKAYGANFFFCECMLVIFLSIGIAPSQGNEESKGKKQNCGQWHKAPLSGRRIAAILQQTAKP